MRSECGQLNDAIRSIVKSYMKALLDAKKLFTVVDRELNTKTQAKKARVTARARKM